SSLWERSDVLRWVLSACALTACVQSKVHECADGFLCPAGLVCAPGQDLCVLPDQLTACAGKAAGAMCMFSGVANAVCMNGVCVENAPPPSLCGNGVIDQGEICDSA